MCGLIVNKEMSFVILARVVNDFTSLEGTTSGGIISEIPKVPSCVS